LDLSELAQNAGAALVEAMVSDSWEGVRGQVLHLFGQHTPGREQDVAQRLQQTRSVVINGDITQRLSAAALWHGRFEALLMNSPDAANELSWIIANLRTPQFVPASQNQQFAHSPMTARRGNISISQTGVDNSRTYNTENTFISYVKSHRGLSITVAAVLVAAAVLAVVLFSSKGSDSNGSSDRSTPTGAATIFIAAVNSRDAAAVKAISCEDRMVIDLDQLKPDAKAELSSSPEEAGEFTIIRFAIFTEANGQRDVSRDDQIHLRNVNGQWCVNDL
jgi:hypothetical protein